jgi:hypothetical protein
MMEYIVLNLPDFVITTDQIHGQRQFVIDVLIAGIGVVIGIVHNAHPYTGFPQSHQNPHPQNDQ